MPPGLLVYSVTQCMLLPLSKGTSSVDSAVHRADNSAHTDRRLRAPSSHKIALQKHQLIADVSSTSVSLG